MGLEIFTQQLEKIGRYRFKEMKIEIHFALQIGSFYLTL